MDNGDAVLLCSNQNWNGEVMYLRNAHNIRDLGDDSKGGRRGFGNTVRSVRVRPFLIEMNITIVTGEDSTLPSGYLDRQAIDRDLSILIERVNAFLGVNLRLYESNGVIKPFK
ncbi:MAG: hypothetical protein HC869_26250 [Rhodospirillales bacterium]|nr:hypothetical protein [Rhodospirillales bacterium]